MPDAKEVIKISIDDIPIEKRPPGKIDVAIVDHVEASEVVEKLDDSGRYSCEIRKPDKTIYWLLIKEDGTVGDVGETSPNHVTTSGFGKLFTFASSAARDKAAAELGSESSRVPRVEHFRGNRGNDLADGGK